MAMVFAHMEKQPKAVRRLDRPGRNQRLAMTSIVCSAFVSGCVGSTTTTNDAGDTALEPASDSGSQRASACNRPNPRLTLDAPSPRNFWEAATELKVMYEPFKGYDDLRAQSTLVVRGDPVALFKGANWRRANSQSNTTVMQLKVTEVLGGDRVDEVFIGFPTGAKHGEYACVPEGPLELYLEEAPWIENPVVTEPRRGVPEGNVLYSVIRPEGLLRERDGEFVDTPLMETYEVGPSVHAF